MPEKQLELSKRSAFFSDPFFADLQGSMRDGLKNQLAEFSARSMGVAGAGLNEAAHNAAHTAAQKAARLLALGQSHQLAWFD